MSDAMKLDLKKNWNINAITLYDRPRKDFYRQVKAADLFTKYGFDAPEKD